MVLVLIVLVLPLVLPPPLPSNLVSHLGVLICSKLSVSNHVDSITKVYNYFNIRGSLCVESTAV